MVPIQRSCDVENLPDFARYYNGSWVGWHPSDATHIMPCYVGGQMDATHLQLRSLARRDGNQFLLDAPMAATWKDLQDHIDFGAPDIGMMPDGPTVLFCSYSTPRVAKKGFRGRETRTVEFNHWDIRRKYAGNGAVRDRYDWVWFVFNPEYKTLEEVEDLLTKGEAVGMPLSRTLAVYSVPKFKHSILAYKRWAIGHVISPYLISLKREYGDYEEDIARQTGAEVIVG